MADHTKRLDNPDRLLDLMDAYKAKFGTAGDFDRWTMTAIGSALVMQEALERGTPPTQEDLRRIYKQVFQEDFPEYPKGAIL